MPSPFKYRSLGRVLESDAQFAEWTARRRHEVALTQLLRKHLPRPLGERIRVTDCRDGAEFREVRVRVQVAALAPLRDAVDARPWDGRQAAPLFDLAQQLPDGPLKAALSRWSRRVRGR